MSVALPMVALLGLVVFLLLRSGELRWWQVVLVGLLGFYLDRTHLSDPIAAFVSSLASSLN
ncbi:hypothetical protein EDD99_5049 [Streptomyces sp. 846.5]|nr:hypothetical protein [Streptomyces sp. 846.5]TDU06490.1 hypothetical protein EDD99_5049 [Streptomyces sp. 846.5]